MGSVGIDVGTMFVKLVAHNELGECQLDLCERHLGNQTRAVQQALRKLPDGHYRFGVTGSGAHLLTAAMRGRPIHTVEADIAAVQSRFPKTRNILNIGAGSCTIIHLDEEGKFLNYSANSLCAAGTGAFLEEQARRLEMSYEDMASFEFDGIPPSIASRCAVFAKSDLIHRQQEGYSREAMWAGLCKGCVDTFLQTLLRGKPLDGKTVVTGGVVKNPMVMKWLRSYYGAQLLTWDGAHLCGALGALALANSESVCLATLLGQIHNTETQAKAEAKRGAPLRLERSCYPDFTVHAEEVDEHGNEIRLCREVVPGPQQVYLGIDIGSTSTKLVLLDQRREVLVDIYRKTLGDPIGAVKRLFAAVEGIAERFGVQYQVLGCGTTGSGRKLIGRIVGADEVVNEITAHVAGATHVDPEIDTIFEIGGQDSKYMRTVGGVIRDANMNFICAAGTGSFVEEQANKLGFAVSEIGDLVMGIAPPETSDRCTVFMEEDTNKLLRQGYSRMDAIAAVMNSIAKNYLNKVVGNRHISRHKIFFQGATARNKGLVAAFENQLQVQMVVSPLCHQMGAFGVALLTGEKMRGKVTSSSFRGFDLSRRHVALTKQHCDGCNNSCAISFASIEGESTRPSWGYMCGKEPDETKRRINREFSFFRRREKLLDADYRAQQVPSTALRVGMPNALTAYSLTPFWTAFFNALDCRLVRSAQTDEQIKKRGTRSASGDFCFPVKAALGQALELRERTDLNYLLIPQVVSGRPNNFTSNALFCPYVQSYGPVVHSTLEMNGIQDQRLLSPVIDFRWDDGRLLRELQRVVGSRLGASRAKLKKGLAAALAAQHRFEQACQEEGRRMLAQLQTTNEKAIAIIGRPYNCFDVGVNISLPEKISEQGYPVVPLDFFPFDPSTLGEEYANIYWHYGQRIIAALKAVAASDHLFAVYLSNFGCGPDSFLLSYAEKIMGEKPLLILELDEHGADAGYMTRVEAFLDVVAAAGRTPRERPTSRPAIQEQGRRAKLARKTNGRASRDLRQRTLWLPPMHPMAARLSAAMFRRYGYDSRALPVEDIRAFETGRRMIRGSECLPTCLTIGGFVKQLQESAAVPSEHALFMPTATGPCRFGQYALLQRHILDRQGYEDVLIVAPSSQNSYQGIEEKVRRALWYAFLAADVLLKMRCRVRPYERVVGESDAATEKGMTAVERVFIEQGDFEATIRAVCETFARIPRREETKPLVGIVGEIYVRCNPFANEEVIDCIERYGGEAWLAPLSEWILYTAHVQRWSARQDLLNFTARGKSLLKNRFLFANEHRIYKWCSPFLDDRQEPPIESVVEAGERFLPINFEGEAIITVGRAIHFLRQGASLVVNCAPFGCMPGTLTIPMLQLIEREMGAPIVSMYYDGGGEMNRRLEIYLRQVRSSRTSSQRPAARKGA